MLVLWGDLMTVALMFLFVCVVWAIVVYNRLVRDRQRVKTAWSDIDVQLKRRYDLIPKLVAAVKQYELGMSVKDVVLRIQ